VSLRCPQQHLVGYERTSRDGRRIQHDGCCACPTCAQRLRIARARAVFEFFPRATCTNLPKGAQYDPPLPAAGRRLRRRRERGRGEKASSSFQWRWDVRVRSLKGEEKKERGLSSTVARYSIINARFVCCLGLANGDRARAQCYGVGSRT